MGRPLIVIGVKYQGRPLLRKIAGRTDFCETCLDPIPPGAVMFRGPGVALCEPCSSKHGDSPLLHKGASGPRPPRLTDKAIACALRNEAARPKWVRGTLARLVGHCESVIAGTCPGAGPEEAASAADLLGLICRLYRESMEVDP